jgi:hypothetical protein
LAIYKVTNSKAKLKSITKYVTNPKKTKDSLVTGKDLLEPSKAFEQMMDTKKMWKKTEGRQYIHGVQSFAKGDINPEKANDLGYELANKCYKGHEVLVVTHTDKDHIHNHLIVNTVNYETGKKHHSNKKDLEKIKESNVKMCQREGLSIPVKSDQVTSFNQQKYYALLKGMTGKEPSYLVQTVKDVKSTMNDSTTRADFIKQMENKGYQVSWKDNRKNVTFTTPDNHKIRNSNLTKTFKYDFSKENMENEFRRNHETRQAIEEQQTTEPTRNNDTTRSRAESTSSSVHRNGQDQVPTQSDVGILGEIEQKVHNATERVERVFGDDRDENREDGKLNTDSQQRIEKDQRELIEQAEREREELERDRSEKYRANELEL